jgi:integrase
MIYDVKKRARRKNGKTVLSRCYSLYYRFDPMVSPKWLALGVSDKEAALAKARKFKREYEAEAAGIIFPKPIREAAVAPLKVLIIDYVSDMRMRVKSSTSKSPKQSKSRLMRLCKECGWQKLSDITADSFVKWRCTTDLSPKTLNHYLAEGITFINFLLKTERILKNPLADVSKLTVKGRESRLRRAFTNEELTSLFRIAPEYRKTAYLSAVLSGLRHGELSKLRWGDVVFESPTPHILARSAISKNGQDARIPMTNQLEKELLNHRPESWTENDLVFPKGVPRARTLRVDLESAGIPYQDEMGRFADFHSFRYTWGTILQKNGVNSRTAMELMRHSDRNLTDKVYTDTNLLPLGEVVRKLPDIQPLTDILTEISGKRGQKQANSGKISPQKNEERIWLDPAYLKGLIKKKILETLVEVAGVEPASRNPSHSASTCLVLSII